MRRVTRSQYLIGFLGAVLCGLGLAKTGASISLEVLIIVLCALIACSKKPRILLLLVIIFGTCLGLYRGAQTYTAVSDYAQFENMQVTMRGVIADDPSYDGLQKQFTLADVAVLDNQSFTPLVGTVRVKSFGVTDAMRGDYVQIAGKLRPPFGNQQGYISFAEVDVQSHKVDWLEDVRRQFFAGMFTAIPEPMASLGLGFLVGIRALLPDELLEQLRRTGLTHIVAVSGYNLTILIRIMRRSGMLISKFTAITGSAALILAFLAVTGLAPSIFRASVVAGFALTAWYFGRTVKPLILLLLSGVITASINPLLLWNDIGWWLSFLAFFGVLILAPLFTVRLYQERQPPLLIQIIIETTSAQIMALPIIMVIFGELSLISLLANMIILPLIPFAMLLGFIAGFAGMVVPEIAGWFAWPATLLLTAMIDMIELLSIVPWALIGVEMSWTVCLLFYAIVCLATYFSYRKLSQQQLDTLRERSVID